MYTLYLNKIIKNGRKRDINNYVICEKNIVMSVGDRVCAALSSKSEYAISGETTRACEEFSM